MSDPLRARAPAGTPPEAPEAFYDPAFLRAALQRAPEGICIARVAPPSPEVRFLLWNRRMEEITGFDVEELRRRGGIPALLPDPAMRERAEAVTVELLRGRDVVEDEWEIRRPDGGLRRVAFAAMVLKREAGDFEILTFMKDITEARRAERALARSARVNERIRTLMAALSACRTTDEMMEPLLDAALDVTGMSGGGIYLVEGGAAVMRRSRGLPDAFLKATARMPMDHPGVRAVAARPEPSDIAEVSPDMAALLASHGMPARAYAVPLRRGAEVVGFLNLASTRDPDPESVRLLGILAAEAGSFFHRVRAEEALRGSEEFLRNVFDTIQDGLSVLDRDLRILRVNRWMERMYAHAAPLVGRKCHEVYHGRTAVCEVCPTVIAIETGETCTRQVPYTTDRGPAGWLDLTAFPLKDADGRVTGVIEHVKDITDRARAEKALRESEEKYGSLFRQSRDGIVLHDLEADVFDANPRILEMLGLAPGAGKPPFDAGVFAPSTGAAFQRAMRTVLERGVAVFETEFRRRDGSLLPAEVTAQLMEIGGRRHIQAIVRDLTERKKAEEERLRLEAQVQHVQKLESLGVLAGGIAHDFNNLLMGILGNADLALQEMSSVAPGRAFLLEIEKASRRAADLCRQMLAYSGKGRFVVEAVDLSELVEEMAHLLQVSVSKKAVLRYHFARGLPPVMADATQMRQVVMNLITNASEAVGDRSGVISVATGLMECDRAYFRGSVLDESLPEGAYAFLEVSDTGVGMTPETLSKIFDPFFTTKFTGRGLGLSAVLGIVRGHKGAVKVYSEPGKGSTFKVLLPVSREAAAARPGKPPAPATDAEAPARGAVLLVDDDPTIRTVGKAMLRKLGYSVIVAKDGNEALEAFRPRAAEIGAVVLDLTMPGMDGEECFRELRRLSPDVRVVLSSGYNEQEVVQRFAGKGLAGFIQKPYVLDELRERLREAFRIPGPGPADAGGGAQVGGEGDHGVGESSGG